MHRHSEESGLILSIESSCDDSSIAVTEISTRRILFHRKISQDSAHSEHGGVVPELASRLHAIALPQILCACRDYLPHIKAIAVTNEPGLSVTLLEGVAMAKALSLSLKLPLIATNHLKGHLYSLFLEQESILPLDALLVSGGHTMLLSAGDFHDIEIVGSSIDDSFGESFDKVAKMLNLGYPGGPIVEKMAQSGDFSRFNFTIPLHGKHDIAFSFSGLKNAVRLAIAELGETPSEQDKCDICASFQRVAIAHLAQKTRRFLCGDSSSFKKARKNGEFCDKNNEESMILPLRKESQRLEDMQMFPQDNRELNEKRALAIIGGASANLALRAEFATIASEFGRRLLLAPLSYCSDNAAMIGRVGIESYERGEFVDISQLEVRARVPRIE